MPKTKQQKQEILENLEKDIEKNKSIIFLDFSGVDAPTLFGLREELKENDCKLLVIKKTLFQKALAAVGDMRFIKRIKEIEGELALAFGFVDEVVPAKICKSFQKKNENLKILGGILNQELIENDKVLALADLPSKPELLGRLVGSLNSPVRGFVYALKGNLSNLVRVLNEIQKVKK